MRESAGVADLRLHVMQCDGVLRGFEEMLAGFQHDLGETGRIMRDMKAKAHALETLAANRTAASAALAAFIQGLTVSPEMEAAIANISTSPGPVDPGLVPALRMLRRKLAFAAHPGAFATEAAEQMKPVLVSLQQRAVQRLSLRFLATVRERVAPTKPFLCLSLSALEATQGQNHSFFSQLPYKCYLEEVASVGD